MKPEEQADFNKVYEQYIVHHPAQQLPPSHIYELRSYHLRPGTMVEWGNYWARAIKLRDYQHSEAYMGLFSQIGELYNVKVGNKSDI